MRPSEVQLPQRVSASPTVTERTVSPPLSAISAVSRDRTSSARNRFVGLVTRVQLDGVMAQVDIQSGPHRVVSLMSSEAVRELDLHVGSLAVAIVKATNVIVETPKV